jgi:hypothetical protein
LVDSVGRQHVISPSTEVSVANYPRMRSSSSSMKREEDGGEDGEEGVGVGVYTASDGRERCGGTNEKKKKCR